MIKNNQKVKINGHWVYLCFLKQMYPLSEQAAEAVDIHKPPGLNSLSFKFTSVKKPLPQWPQHLW